METNSGSCYGTADRTQIVLRLSKNPQVRPRNLQVQACEGKLVIDGEVDSFYAKQMAQESIRDINGIGIIENRLMVAR